MRSVVVMGSTRGIGFGLAREFLMTDLLTGGEEADLDGGTRRPRRDGRAVPGGTRAGQ